MKNSVIILLILCATILEYRTVAMIHDHYWLNEVVTGNQSIMQGEAECYVFQSRVLGPAIVQAMQVMFDIPFSSALYGFFFCGMLVTNLVVYFLIEMDKGILIAYLFTILNAVAFTFLQDKHAIFTFDVIDSLTMFLFAYGCFERKGFWFMAALFAVEIHNREFAFVIAGWIILDGLDRVRFWQSLPGCVMLYGGKFYVDWLRRTLSIHEHHDERVVVKFGQNFYWPWNWQQIKTVFADKFIPISWNYATRLDQVICMLVIVSSFLVSVWYLYRNSSLHSFNIFIVICAFITSVLLFTCMSEPRGLEQLAPFMLFTLFWQDNKHHNQIMNGQWNFLNDI